LENDNCVFPTAKLEFFDHSELAEIVPWRLQQRSTTANVLNMYNSENIIIFILKEQKITA